MTMYANICLAIIVLGCLSAAKAQDLFCSGSLCFIMPETNSGKPWSAAQQTCKDNNSTLPIANDTKSRMSVIEALNHFQLHGRDVWLGATASDNGPDIWRWLNGSQYNGTDVQQRGEYTKSYAYVAKTTNGVLAYAFPPSSSFSYICQCKSTNTDICTNDTGRTAFVKDNECFINYDERLSWFNARNKCLANSCDLASFPQLSILDGMVDSSGFWIGLRTSQWNWQNAVTGVTSDVKYTSWSIGQPDDAAPHCIAISSGNFPNWKDIDCAIVFPYICQVSDIRSTTTPSSPFRTTATTSARFILTTASTTTTMSPLVTPGTDRTSTSVTTSTTVTMSPLETPGADRANAGSSNAALAIGLCVGLGIPVIIVVIVVAVVLRRKHQSRQLQRDGAKIEPEYANSKETSTPSLPSALPPVESDANNHYQQLQNNHELQEQQQYEQLQQAQQYEQLQRRNELQEQQQYEQLPQNPQYEQL